MQNFSASFFFMSWKRLWLASFGSFFVVSFGALKRKKRIAAPVRTKAIFRKRGLILLLGGVVMVFVLGVE
jgi:hypothetical protein